MPKRKATAWLIEDNEGMRDTLVSVLGREFGDILDVKTFAYLRDTKGASSRPEYIILDIASIDIPTLFFGELTDGQYSEVLRSLRKYFANHKSAAIFIYSMVGSHASGVVFDIKEACEEEGVAVMYTDVNSGHSNDIEKMLAPYMEAERKSAKRNKKRGAT